MESLVREMDELKKETLVFYMHIALGVTALGLASGAPQEEEEEGILGQLSGFAVPITEGPDRQSRGLGFVRGLSFINSPASVNPSPNVAPSKEHLLNTIHYDDGVVKGTIAQHGFINFPPPYFDGSELAVVGGTGAFRRVQGYSNPTLISSTPLVIRWEVHLFHPKAHPSSPFSSHGTCIL